MRQALSAVPLGRYVRLPCGCAGVLYSANLAALERIIKQQGLGVEASDWPVVALDGVACGDHRGRGMVAFPPELEVETDT